MRKAGSIWESYNTAEKVNGQFLLLLWSCALIVLLIPKIIKKILQASIHTVLVHLAEKYTASKKQKSLVSENKLYKNICKCIYSKEIREQSNASTQTGFPNYTELRAVR